jgi:hypothetical protein
MLICGGPERSSHAMLNDSCRALRGDLGLGDQHLACHLVLPGEQGRLLQQLFQTRRLVNDLLYLQIVALVLRGVLESDEVLRIVRHLLLGRVEQDPHQHSLGQALHALLVIRFVERQQQAQHIEHPFERARIGRRGDLDQMAA